MVKAKKSGGSRLRQKFARSKEAPADQEAGPSGRPAEAPEGPAPPRKLQNKLAKRVSFFERVAQSGLAAKASIKKKRRRAGTGAALGNLSALSEALTGVETAAAARKSAPAKGLSAGGAKARKRISAQETVRLQQVLAHPQFRADPIAAVASHLEAQLPPPVPPQPARKNVSGSRRQKMRRQKARMQDD